MGDVFLVSLWKCLSAFICSKLRITWAKRLLPRQRKVKSLNASKCSGVAFGLAITTESSFKATLISKLPWKQHPAILCCRESLLLGLYKQVESNCAEIKFSLSFLRHLTIFGVLGVAGMSIFEAPRGTLKTSNGIWVVLNWRGVACEWIEYSFADWQKYGLEMAILNFTM